MHVLLLLVLLAMPLPAWAEAGDYAVVDGPCGLAFPRDHGPHPEHRTEWWYYTGNLESETGRRFGYQLTFFRRRMAPPAETALWPPAPSAWRTHQLWLAHFALSDGANARFHHSEEALRGAVGLAGAEQRGDAWRVWLGDWSTTIGPQTHRVAAEAEEIAIDLSLAPAKELVTHGPDGYSRKGERVESASCYYSFTRLVTAGSLRIGGETFAVSGSSWMDREWSSAALEKGLQGWDWFSIQLHDGREVMLYVLRKEDGTPNSASGGTFVAADGAVAHFRMDTVELTVTDTWMSPSTEATYPAGWRLALPEFDLDLRIDPIFADQELVTAESTGVTYWEGAVDILADGERAGVGYVELTGYAGGFEADI